MGPIGLTELIIILVIVVVLFGAKRLPDLARGVAQSIRGFKEEMKPGESEDKPKTKDHGA